MAYVVTVPLLLVQSASLGGTVYLAQGQVLPADAVNTAQFLADGKIALTSAPQPQIPVVSDGTSIYAGGVPVAAGSDERPTRQAAVYAVSSIDTLAKAQAWKAAGGTHVLLPFYWDRFQASSGAALSSSALIEVRTWISNARQAGLRCIGEVNIASTPSWYQAAVPPFQQQNGTQYTATGIRDMIWSKTARVAIADYIAKLFALLTVDDLEVIDTFRVGGGPLGELSTPDSHFSNNGTPDWWCYSPAAGGSSDLADGMTPRPFTTTTYPFNATPGGTAGSAADVTGYSWYTQSVTTFMRWLIAQHRNAGWRGALHVLLPSFGVRWKVGDGDTNNRYELAQGTDWASHIDGFNDHNVHPWNTWGNRADNATVNGEQDYSPSRYLAYLARQKGCDSFLLCENAAGASDAHATAMWTDPNGVMQRGYRGVMWVSWDDLTGGTAGKATLANVTSLQAGRPAAGRVKPSPATPAVLTSVRRPIDLGYLGWTADPALVGSSGAVLATGVFNLTRVRLAKGRSKGVHAYLTNSAATLSSAYLALLKTDGTVLAVTADVSATLMGAAGLLPLTWATPANLPAEDDYLIGVIATGTTGPGLLVPTNASSPTPVINAVAPGFVKTTQAFTVSAAGPTFPAVGSQLSLAGLSATNRVLWYAGY